MRPQEIAKVLRDSRPAAHELHAPLSTCMCGQHVLYRAVCRNFSDALTKKGEDFNIDDFYKECGF